MSPDSSELRQHLQTVLSELDKLSKQIRDSHDLSDSAELVLCLRELVQEQVESQYREDSCSTTHSIR
jgi:hypothetical protein